MRKFKMTEISSVDRPAQGPAVSVLMKRHDSTEEGIEKRFYMTENCRNVAEVISSTFKGPSGHFHN